MARNRKRISLYEIIGRTGFKTSYGKGLEHPHPGESGKDKPVFEKLTRWRKRPGIVQFNAGRIEISVPYQIAIALLLGIILLILVVFRLGQSSYEEKITNSAAEIPKAAQRTTVGRPTAPAVVKNILPTTVEAKPAESKGNNNIVIQTYRRKADLEPVKDYLAGYGIETQIRKVNEWYYLITTAKYENIAEPGTDGYAAKKEIIELGVKYKAPQGYETFGPKSFQTAYGRKFDD